MAAPLVLYNSFHMEDNEGWHYMYTPDKHYLNWKFDGPTFYAYTTQQPGTVPIYRDSAGSPARYRFTADPQPGEGWHRDPHPAFYAYPYGKNKAAPAGTVPIYSFHAVGSEGWRYSYTTEPLWGVGWQYDGVDFYTPLPSSQPITIYNYPPSIQKLPVRDEYELGWGVNVANGSLREHAISGLHTTSWNDFSEIRDIHVFASSEEFARTTQEFVLFQACALGSSLSASADFLLSTSVSETCLSIEADSTVRTRIELLDLDHGSPQLDNEALNLLKHDPAGFINRYGTHFIGGFVYGGYFVGILNLVASSITQKAQLAVDFKETINLWLASKSTAGQFSASLSHTQVKYKLEARATISGRPVATPIENPDALIDEANHFAQQLQSQPGQGVRQIAVCYSWDVLPQVVQVLDTLPADKQKLFHQSIQPDVLQELAAELARLGYLQNTVNALLSSSDAHIATHKVELEQASGDIQAAISKIKSLDVHGLASLDMQSVKQFEAAGTLLHKISSFS